MILREDAQKIYESHSISYVQNPSFPSFKGRLFRGMIFYDINRFNMFLEMPAPRLMNAFPGMFEIYTVHHYILEFIFTSYS